MMNFLFGTVAGGLIACIATIAAARHPDVQARLGLVKPAAPIMLSAAPALRADCSCPASPGKALDLSAGQTDLLFSRRRFWFVAPH